MHATLFGALVALCLMPACGRSKESRCKRFADDGIAMTMGIANGVADGLSKQLGSGEDVPDVALPKEDLALAKSKLIEECMTWPDKFVYCVTDGDFDSEECRVAYAEKEGVVVSVEGVVGPAPKMRPMAKYSTVHCADGRCVVDGEGGLTAIDGTPLVEGDVVGAVELGGKSFVLTHKDGEIALVGADKDDIKRVTAPRLEPDDPFIIPVAATGKGLVLFDDGHVRRLLQPPCETCFEETPWKLAGSASGWDFPELHALHDGGLAYHGGSHLIAFASDGTRRLHLHARDETSSPRFVGNDLYIGLGKEAFALDLTHCKSEGPIEPEELTSPCVKARIPMTEAAWATPVVLGTSAYFFADGRVHQLVDGKKGWSADIECTGLLGFERDGVRFLAAVQHWTYDHPGRLLLLDPETGRTLVQSDVDRGDYKFTDFGLDADREHVFVTARDDLYTWDIAALAAAIPE